LAGAAVDPPAGEAFHTYAAWWVDVNTIKFYLDDPVPQRAMYQSLEKPDWKKAQVQFVPYYAWRNRGRSEMSVWLPLVWKEPANLR